MLHRGSVSRRLLFCICSLLVASCGSPHRKVENERAHAVVSVPGDAQARAAAYAERMRLGLGSPFRLIEMAARDRRLGAAADDVARQLFTQLERGPSYEVSPHALVAAGSSESSAIAQLELIEQAIARAKNPLVGELAVNLAYELAVAERTVSPAVAARAIRIVALVRDRELALADAKQLRAAARRLHESPDNLIMAWRAERRLAVEQPTLAPLDGSAQNDAARLALLLVGGIRSAAVPVHSVLQRTATSSVSLLTPVAAATLLRDTTSAEQAALLITLRTLGQARQDGALGQDARKWHWFLKHATDEERLVAALALVRQDPTHDVAAAGIALEAAITLRAFAQERIASDTLELQDLARRYSVRVRFHGTVGEAQRGRAIEVLGNALADMRAAIRTLDVSGLTFEIGPIAANAPHLAFHDPRRRVIRLDPATMAGTIAHEVGHDLDWQLAARKYRTRANYATDFATRNRRALAYAVESLSGTAQMAQTSGADAAARRPAEIFARRFEWYVASALALQGRSSGYLSSVQSDWIAGYGSAVRPEATAAAAKSFAALVAEAANMDRSDLAAVQRTVIESSPLITRLLKRATESGAHSRQLTLNELREWECAAAWQSARDSRSGLYRFLDVLTDAAHDGPSKVDSVRGVVTLDPVRAIVGNSLGLHGRGCNRLNGVFLAQSVR